MPAAICTISTQSHLFKVKALYQSLHDKTGADFYCLTTDGTPSESFEKINYLRLDEIPNESLKGLRNKYTGNKLRWSCKPVIIQHLLEHGYDKVIYVDNDIFFYESPDFLFDQLDTKSILLTPHFYPANPTKEQIWLEANFRVGLYNGGFIGANKSAIEPMKWWTACCLYNVKKSFWRGLFDDQKYLDLFPVLFENVEILKHKGCNVAGWNIETSPRSLNEAGEVILDGKWPLVFVHYNYYTIECIVTGKDDILNHGLNTYMEILTRYKSNYNRAHEKGGSIHQLNRYFSYIRFRIARMLE